MNKKDEVLTALFKSCQQKNDYIFHNDLVKDIARKVGFGNPFDATKIDNKDKLPEILLENDYAVIHLGNGNHQFIKGIFGVYVVKTIENGVTNLKIWAYTFENPLDITSIKFVKSVCYQLNV